MWKYQMINRESIKFDGQNESNDYDMKLRWDLLPMNVIEEIVKIYSYGAKKYGDNRWQNLENYEDRYFAACMRHLIAWRNGKQVDPESTHFHLAHSIWNLISLLWKDLQEKNK